MSWERAERLALDVKALERDLELANKEIARLRQVLAVRGLACIQPTHCQWVNKDMPSTEVLAQIEALKVRIETAKEEQREACAQNIEKTSLLQGRPMTAAWCRATPTVKEQK